MRKREGSFGSIGLILGALSIPAFYWPIFGMLLGILGLIFSVQGLRKSQSFAMAGYTCSLIGLTASVTNSLIGALYGALGLI